MRISQHTWLPVITALMKVCVCFQIKTQQVLGEFLKMLPRVTGKKGTFVPHLFQTLIRWVATHILSPNCYCITQTNSSGASWLTRLHRGPGSGWNRGPATFVLGVFAYRLTTSGRVFVLMQQEKKKRMKSLYLGLSIDRSGACDTAAAPQRSVTH